MLFVKIKFNPEIRCITIIIFIGSYNQCRAFSKKINEDYSLEKYVIIFFIYLNFYLFLILRKVITVKITHQPLRIKNVDNLF